MSKERLEEINRFIRGQTYDRLLVPNTVVNIKYEDYKLLYEKAERVQELEEKLKDRDSAISTGIHVSNLMKKQNKRYRERIEYMLEEAKDHKRKGLRIQHWALIKDLEETLEGRGMKLIDLLIKHTKEVWYAGECECGESKYDLVTEPQAIYPPVHESTIRKVKPELLEESE